MKDGEACPECGCGIMFLISATMPIARCSWCGHRERTDDIERPRRKEIEPSQTRL